MRRCTEGACRERECDADEETGKQNINLGSSCLDMSHVP